MKLLNAKRTVLTALAALAVAAAAQAADISGAGATFPYPVYSKWADAYKKQTGIGLNYQSIGSGGGIKQIKAKTVTFGASDMPLKPEELKEAGLVQFPMIIGGVVPVVNVKGVDRGAADARRRHARQHLPGRDHQVERRAHQEAESEAGAAGHRDRPDLPLGRLGHELPVHGLSVQVQPEVQGLRSAPTPRCSGRSASAPRVTKASPT